MKDGKETSRRLEAKINLSERIGRTLLGEEKDELIIQGLVHGPRVLS